MPISAMLLGAELFVLGLFVSVESAVPSLSTPNVRPRPPPTHAPCVGSAGLAFGGQGSLVLSHASCACPSHRWSV